MGGPGTVVQEIFARVPRILMWTAAGLAAAAILTVIVVQIMLVVMVTRPPMLTRWLQGIFAIAAQSIFASIALAIASFALHSSNPQGQRPRLVIAETAQRPATPSASATQPETKLPSGLRSAIAAASGKERRD